MATQSKETPMQLAEILSDLVSLRVCVRHHSISSTPSSPLPCLYNPHDSPILIHPRIPPQQSLSYPLVQTPPPLPPPLPPISHLRTRKTPQRLKIRI